MKNNLRNGLAALLMLSCTCAYAQMSGTYTIGGDNPDFTTINAAYNALKAQGASGDITFDIRPGTYNETLSFTGFKSLPYTKFTLNGTNATITSTNNRATIYVEMEQFKMNGLTVKNTGTGAAIRMYCGYNTFTNNTFEATGAAVVYYDFISDVLFQNNTVIGGDYGIYAETPSFNKFYDNDISQFRKAGFYTTGDNNYADRSGNELKRNYFESKRPSSNITNDFCAIDILFGHDYIIDNNEIQITSISLPSKTYGIYIHSGDEDLNDNILTNNYISVGGTGVKVINSGTTALTNNSVFVSGGKGIDISDNATLINNEVTSYSNDCIYIGGSATAINNSTFLYNSSTGSAFRATTGTKIVNNSFFNSSTNANTSAINLGSAATCDYNNLYSLSSKLGVFNNVSKVSLSAWRSATGKDSHSISADPLYSDPELCSMQINLSSPLVNRALASEMPSYDITGEARDYNAIGAWDPYPHTSWYTRSAGQRAYDIRKAIRESMEMNSLLDEQNAETSNIATLQYSINYSSGLLNVISSEKEDATYTLCIADMLTGETRIQTPTVLVDGISQSVDLSALASGYYVVRLVTDADTYSWKINK